jgi:hypothetical protein
MLISGLMVMLGDTMATVEELAPLGVAALAVSFSVMVKGYDPAAAVIAAVPVVQVNFETGLSVAQVNPAGSPVGAGVN